MSTLAKLRVGFRRPIDWLDGFLDSITSYRLLLYVLLAILGTGVWGSLLGEVSFTWQHILLSAGCLALVCWLVNRAWARALDVPTNKHSELITALILTLVLTPGQTYRDYLILAAAAAMAMSSKYILAFRRSHVFNPAAVGAFSVGAAFSYHASWWVGTTFLTPVVLAGGILILRKMKRFRMVLIFLAVYVGWLIWRLHTGTNSSIVAHVVWLSLSATPALFFAVVMLVEPLTSPARRYLSYAVLVSVLYSVPSLHFAPEEALLIGNLLTAIIEPHPRWRLRLIKRVNEARGITSYLFKPSLAFKFKPGQYLEWTLPGAKSDARGNRRYLTISASPTESHLMFTIRQPARSSAFKARLKKLPLGHNILASHLAGSFTLPKKTEPKLVFIAGGVGITPFRSIIKYLIDTKDRRDITLLYAADAAQEFAFTSLFKKAEAVGLKTFFTLTAEPKPAGWRGRHGRIDAVMIKKLVPDYKQRRFYVSGPYGLVRAVRDELFKLGVKPRRIKTDYFPGYG